MLIQGVREFSIHKALIIHAIIGITDEILNEPNRSSHYSPRVEGISIILDGYYSYPYNPRYY